MASRSCALLAAVLLLCAGSTCSSRFLQDGENHAHEQQWSGKDVPWNMGGVSPGGGTADVGVAAESRDAAVGAGAGFRMRSAEEDGGFGLASAVADHGLGTGEGHGRGKGYISGPEAGAGYGCGQGAGSGSGTGEDFGEGGVPCFVDPSQGQSGGGGGYPSAGCCSCGMVNFPIPFFGYPFPGWFPHRGAKGSAAVTKTHHMNLVSHEPMPPTESEMKINNAPQQRQ
ncbi:hypothetical protein MLD38_022001 [Melastoma candidum]|uniref:Uncharacterized protein n=1 Tax=Melastoma candidum TaxID=119954 RepID=A0ACB9QIS8_9MYRT|nr:hypothetical protein MLD38_022001 [Melastoma candidum]